MRTIYSIYAVGNEKTKTYDIVKVWDYGPMTVYRTTELSEQEFEELEYNTSNDWQNFLNTSQNYYLVEV